MDAYFAGTTGESGGCEVDEGWEAFGDFPGGVDGVLGFEGL